MFRSDARIIKSGRNGIDRCDLSILILTEIRFHPMKNTKLSGCDGCSRLESINTSSRSLTANKTDTLVLNKMIKRANGIGSSAHTCQHSIWQFSFCCHTLLLDLLGNHCLKITDNGWKWM